MSVIGPRPQLVRDMVFMTPEQRRKREMYEKQLYQFYVAEIVIGITAAI